MEELRSLYSTISEIPLEHIVYSGVALISATLVSAGILGRSIQKTLRGYERTPDAPPQRTNSKI